MSKGIAAAVGGMTAAIVLSNVLVQYPFAYTIGSLDLANLLTWGAFTYPVVFLVTDSTNRLLGPKDARRVVYAGFLVAAALSYALATPRIAMASATAFLVGQLLDIAVFNRLRRHAWWKAPAISSVASSVLDTAAFFSLAFAATGLPWMTWALGDFAVKLAFVAVALVPYRLVVALLLPRPALVA